MTISSAETPLLRGTPVIIGIDPGLLGAVARLAVGDPPQVWDTPTETVTTARRMRREYDLRAMANLLITVTAGMTTMGSTLAVIEVAGPRPGEGVVSVYRIGFGAGVWQGLCAGLGLPFRCVLPAVWKRSLGLLGQGKSASRLKAGELFPSLVLPRVRDHNAADAVLLAAYARQQGW